MRWFSRPVAHGIIKGNSEGRCLLNYVSRKEIVNIGDAVVSSGLDGVFAKGLLIGKGDRYHSEQVRNISGYRGFSFR